MNPASPRIAALVIFCDASASMQPTQPESAILAIKLALASVCTGPSVDPRPAVPSRRPRPEPRDRRGSWIKMPEKRGSEPMMATLIRDAASRCGGGAARRKVSGPGSKMPIQVQEIVDGFCVEHYATPFRLIIETHARIVDAVRRLNEQRRAAGHLGFAIPSYVTVRRRVRATQPLADWFGDRARNVG